MNLHRLQTICICLVFAILMLLLDANAAVLLSSDTDKATLLAFKAGLRPDAGNILSSWNDSSHICQWQGVTCGRRHKRVTSLDLHGQGLAGTISPHIGNLSFLRRINLRGNELHGQIPPQLGRLSRLQDLIVSQNSLEGEVPTNLSHCYNLRVLGLGNNMLVGHFPEVLTNFPNLVELNLSTNSFVGSIPNSIGNLSSLQYLSVLRNNLEGSIPSSLGRVKSLKGLYLSVNSLSRTLPQSIYNLSSIEILYLTMNRLQGSLPWDLGLLLPNLVVLGFGANQFSGSIPTSLSNSSRLQLIQLTENNFIGKVPTDLGKLQRLKGLVLGGNQLGEGGDLDFITSLTNCTSLSQIELSDNAFSGQFPESISNLSTQLSRFTLGSQYRGPSAIFGKIPLGISNLVGLEFLFLQGTSLSGDIPPGIGKLPKLQGLILSGNRLSGQIPASLCNSSRLITLYLSGNNLEGSIPSSIGNCQNLLNINIGGNKLNGTIPNEIFNISSLSQLLRLSSNSLTGPLPLDIGKLKLLAVFLAEDNQLFGEIPSSLEFCQSMEVLNLRNNSFSGVIPLSLRNLRGVRRLDLSQNNLSGQIPEFLGNFTLKFLNLSFNHFEGEVPQGGIFKNASAVSIAGNNKLCGGSQNLHLSACPKKKSIHRRKKIVLRMTIILVFSFVIFFLLCAIVVIICKRRWKNKGASSMPSMGSKYLKVSYKDLFKATNGFSSENLIGSGRHGFVYKGTLEQGRLAIAVKVLNLQFQGASTTFMAECNALRNIRHRNLIKILTSCSTIDYKGNDFKALVFELMPNGSLETWLHKSNEEKDNLKNLNLLQRLNVAIDIASALDYLHNHCQIPIVHCDLKPSNVLLDEDFSARMTDFGLAKFLQEVPNNVGEDQSSSIAVKGTVGYVPPEYGASGRVTVYGDVYSYGIVLLEMFTGKRPTEEIFSDGLTLHTYVQRALPTQVLEISDKQMLLEDVNCSDETIMKCLTRVLKVGVSCSLQPPNERTEIGEALRELNAIRNTIVQECMTQTRIS